MITQSRLTELLKRRSRRRKIQRPAAPNTPERLYLGLMRRYADRLIDLFKDGLEKSGFRIDAVDRFKRAREIENVSGQLNQVAEAVIRHGKKDARRVLGLESQDLAPGHLVSGWRAENVRLITNFTEEMTDRMDRLISVNYGKPVQDVADQIQSIFDTTRSRAELIARDQTLKLNSQVTQEAQRTAGVDRYIWSTSQDGSVRDDHAELEGQMFSWSDPPVTNKQGETNHPGQDYQCRCVPIPYIEELADLY